MIKYMHIERLGNDEVEGILIGTVFVQPKIDGTNGQIYYDGETNRIFCASRRRELAEDTTNQGFWNHIDENAEIFQSYFDEHPDHILYGEWLVPHTLKTYRKDAWRQFYVFDVFDSRYDMFISYDKYAEDLGECNIHFIPVLAKLNNPTEEGVKKFLESNQFLIEDGKGLGEGLVIKNYGFINKYGRPVWAKVVRNEFKEEHNITMGYPEVDFLPVELKISTQFVTKGRLDKIKEKILAEKETGWQSKYIPEYLGRVWFEIIQDEMWNILKKFKNPKIDFRALNKFVIQTIKNLDKEIF